MVRQDEPLQSLKRRRSGIVHRGEFLLYTEGIKIYRFFDHDRFPNGFFLTGQIPKPLLAAERFIETSY